MASNNSNKSAAAQSSAPSQAAGLSDEDVAQGFILVRLAKKFSDRIFHEFHDDHPNKTAQGGELLVVSDRVVKAAPTMSVRQAIAKGVLEDVSRKGVESPVAPNVLDVLNEKVQPFQPPAAGQTPASTEGAPSSDGESGGEQAEK